MKNIVNKNSLPSYLVTGVVATALIASLFAPSLADAGNNKEKHEQKNNSIFTRLSAHASSGVLKFLPPGIAKKFQNGTWNWPGNGQSDTTKPVISEIESDDIGTSTATVEWETNENTTGTLYLSLQSPVDKTDDDTIVLVDTNWSTDHELHVEDLLANTTYYGVIKATDKAGNKTVSSEFSFTTETTDNDTTAPIIPGINVNELVTSATVNWDTNENATSKLYLSTTNPLDVEASTTMEVSSGSMTQDHTLVATGLISDTTYYAKVVSTDASGNTATSSQFQFDTLVAPDVTAPLLSAIVWNAGTSSIDVSWTTNEPATSAVYSSTTSGFALNDVNVHVENDTTLKTSHDMTVDGLTVSTTYYHRLVSVDASGNQVISAQYSLGTN